MPRPPAILSDTTVEEFILKFGEAYHLTEAQSKRLIPHYSAGDSFTDVLAKVFKRLDEGLDHMSTMIADHDQMIKDAAEYGNGTHLDAHCAAWTDLTTAVEFLL